MRKRITKAVAYAFGVCILAALLGIGLLDYHIPKSITVENGESLPSYPCVSLTTPVSESFRSDYSESVTCAKLFGVIPLKEITVKKFDGVTLIPGGMTFGMQLLTDGVLTVGFSDIRTGGKIVCPAREAGILPKDVIIKIDGKPLSTVGELTRRMEEAKGKTLSVTVRRDGGEKTFSLTPVLSDDDGKYKSGVWVRETATGIGTVTFISPETGAFGALGHGVCDSETGSLVPMSRGTVTEVELSEIVKGEKGTPGELRGYLTERKIGSVLTNTDCGVFGVFTKVPGSGTPIPVGSSGEVKTGKASVLCAPDGGEVKEYGIDITEIRRQGQTKSFTIKVTDPELLAKTGGIVQGMSGSPILQNGKLVGAVTHVLVNDPTSGYGIFIESMLSVMPETLAPAA